jgi:hypothetical protein
MNKRELTFLQLISLLECINFIFGMVVCYLLLWAFGMIK